MISEFQELSDKIDQLAALTQSLRRENAQLRQSNALLGAENLAHMHRLGEAQHRIEALLATMPDPDEAREGELEAEANSEPGVPAGTHHKDAR